MFDGGGFGSGQLLSNDAFLTLSFAADGVNVAGQSNGLAAKFNSLPAQGGFANWQDAILKAFQTWATLSNADIGVVPDGGQPFGSTGATRGDARFGDIRIAAIAMDSAVGGEAIPVNQVVGGTWQADVLFNTNFTYQSLSDVFAIALHEAGHVFGLGHSIDPNSPMYGGTALTATTPTAADIADLRALYGMRLPDFNEQNGGGQTNNDSFLNATDVTHSDEPGTVPGSVPLIAYGDITSNADVDFFKFDVPDLYSGPINIEVRSTGISLLAPKLQVYDKQQQLLQVISSTSTAGDTLAYTIPLDLKDKYYFAVSGASSDLLGLGGYAVKVTFPATPQIDTSVLDQYGDRNLRKLSTEDIRKLLVPSLDDFVNEDNHTDDNLIAAVNLAPESDFVDPSRFETIGSISNATDIDFYRVNAPENITAQSNVLTVAIQTLSDGKLVPAVRVYDRHQNLLPATILANGGGELVVQIGNITSGDAYYVEVAAHDPVGPFNTGNYELTASFRDQAVNFTTFATGTVNPNGTQNTHSLYVAQPQLFHFVLHAGSAAVTAPTAVIASIYNDANVLVYRLSTPVGQTQSQNAVLLAPGTYTVKISTLSLQQPVTVPIAYSLSGIAISDPFASDPNDQTTHPFANPNPPPAFVYPGGIFSNDPFLWTDFISSQNSPPPDLQSQISLLLGSWWSWFWNQTGANGPPLGQDDAFATPRDTLLNVAPNSGVLSNDVEPEGEPMVAALVTPPRVGTLQFNADGSFQYTPPVDFNGAVQFVYQASDFHQLSAPVTVTLAVGLLGDYDHNGNVNQADYDTWRSTFGSTTILDADGNGNGVVDQGDYLAWRRNLGLSAGASLAVSTASSALEAPAPVADTAIAATVTSLAETIPSSPSVAFTSAIVMNGMPSLSVAGSTDSITVVEPSTPLNSLNANQTMLMLLDAPPAIDAIAATDAAFTPATAATSTPSADTDLSLDALDRALANLWSTM